MAARASWKGHLRVGKIACAVTMHVAQSDRDKVSFNLLNRKTGHRLRQQMIDEKTHKPVEREDAVKGIAVAKNRYAPLSDEELETIRVESTHTLCIERFVARDEVEPERADGVHYLAPGDAVGQQLFALLRDVMDERDLCGVGRVVLSTRERLVALRPHGAGMLVVTLRWPDQIRKAEEVFADVPDDDADEEMLDLATHIVERKRAAFDFDACEDEFEEAVADLIRAKQEGRAPTPRAAPRPEPVSDLRAALLDSVKAEGGAPSAAKRRPPRKGRRAGATPKRKAS